MFQASLQKEHSGHGLVYSDYSGLFNIFCLKGDMCKIFVLFPQDPKVPNEKVGVFVKRPLRNFKKAKGNDNYLKNHKATEYHQRASIATADFLRTYNEPEKRINQIKSMEKMQYE